ncbi:sirohydrochlorin chelatase [Streptomyces sp. NPDC058657]|uniref:sirohydrochlorin chelatase n=1 Tax=unclassified Streptomyces TaxID=2593676 RepID=UPI0036507DE6
MSAHPYGGGAGRRLLAVPVSTATAPAPLPRTALPAPPLLAVAHGTRDPEGTAATEALLGLVRELRPGLRVQLAYVDVVRPALAEVLARLSGEVVLVPLLLGTGFHIRADIPAALADAPQVRARIAGALGPDPLLAHALADRLSQARAPSRGPVVLASAGSSDPRSQRDTAAMAGLLTEHLGRPAVPSYLCGGSPTPAEAVAALRAAGHREVTVSSYLMTPGHFARKAAAAARGPETGTGRGTGTGTGTGTGETVQKSRPGAGTDPEGTEGTESQVWVKSVVSAPLGAHEAVARLVLARYDEAAAG